MLRDSLLRNLRYIIISTLCYKCCSLVSLGSPGSWGSDCLLSGLLGVPGVLGATVCSLVPPGLKEGADLDLEWRTWTPTPALRRVGGALGVQWGPVLRVSAPCPAPPG